MKDKTTLRLLLICVAAFATATAAAQDRDPSRERPRSAPPHADSRAGTVTDSTGSAGIAGPSEHGTDAGAPNAPTAEPEVPHADTAVKQQAQAKRRAALEHCQTITGASRTDCVQRADEEFKRATTDDTLSDRGPVPPLG
jgi:hypothetical protein